jgi:proline iminopeptidase
MQVEVRGTTLWFDVDGASLVPDGPEMRTRPTLVLLHGGPGGYDHSYFKPWFGALTDVAQVVYLDLRDHGRSGRGDPTAWSFEVCADDVAACCAAIGVERPVVLGHSMGGFVAILLGARHPEVAAALILQSTMARFDLDRLVDGIRAHAGDVVAALARRDYSGAGAVTDAEWAQVFAAFGPHVPDGTTLARRRRNPAVGDHGMDLMRNLDLLPDLPRIECPTLVCVGERDGVTPPGTAREILAGLRPGIGRLALLPDAGHFPWLDDADGYLDTLRAFITEVTVARR